MPRSWSNSQSHLLEVSGVDVWASTSLKPEGTDYIHSIVSGLVDELIQSWFDWEKVSFRGYGMI